ncbi:MAG: AMP-binding protein, partial [Phycisphaeraceae bacterium]|nr:AMP-binding protein [Phycisphaeraceae bacterium]
FARGDVWMVSLPMYHVGGLALIMRALWRGGSLQFAGRDWQAVLVKKTVTHLSVVPTQLKRLLDIPEARRALQSLKVVLVGGAPCPESLVVQAQALDIPIYMTYGASEAASQITTTREVPIGSGSVLSHGQVCINEGNEILVKGQSLARGYVTEGQLVPCVDEHGWFHTGDLGSLDDHGNLFVRGRKDTQFISGGENIWPEEIERALLQHPEVEQCVVVSVPDVTFGQRPVAFVACSAGCRLCDQALTQALSQLEKFKHPDHVFDWPKDLTDHLKPDRPFMQALAKSLLAME